VKDDKFYTRQDGIDNVKEWEWIEDETGLGLVLCKIGMIVIKRRF
jgi:hypothetical protein